MTPSNSTSPVFLTQFSQTHQEPEPFQEKLHRIMLQVRNQLKHPRHNPLQNFCLITGCPRSGTTAVCQWLNSQRQVSVFFESRILVSTNQFVREVLRSRDLSQDDAALMELARTLIHDYYNYSRILWGKTLIIDKEPLHPTAFPTQDYEEFIQNIRHLLPGIKLLFMIRDPLATIWSMRQRKWGYSLTDFEPKEYSLEEHIGVWCANADLILKFHADPDVYVCPFGELVNQSQHQSQKVLDFLNIKNGKMFQPRPTQSIGFNQAHKDLILDTVQSRLDLLQQANIGIL